MSKSPGHVAKPGQLAQAGPNRQKTRLDRGSTTKPYRPDHIPFDDETVIETSYKFQISKELSLLGDAQVIFNPANNPGESSLWVFGVRAIFTL